MAALAHQIPLQFASSPRYSRDDFLHSDANATALAWVEGWPGLWPAYGLGVHGPRGCGKTHLLHIWCAHVQAHIVTAELLSEVAPTELAASQARLAIDNVDALVRNPDGERQLFHLMNSVKEAGGSLLLTSAVPLSHIDIALPDLRSRLTMLPDVAVEAPDDALLEALFVKLLHDRQVRVGERVIRFLVGRVERSFPAVQDAVAQLDHAAMSHKHPVTIALAKSVLAL